MSKHRNPLVTVGNAEYLRIPIRTHRITSADDIASVVEQYTKGKVEEGDIVFISEKVAAVSQGRAIPESQIKIGLLANILWRFVAKVPYGIGLRRPSSMQCAINECGAARILLAAVVGGLGKLVGRKGDFYRIAGMQAATIDAATTSPLQPDCVILGPKDPDGVARRIKERTGCEAAIVDVNDIGGSWVLGASERADRKLVEAALKDNPLGQKDEQTPFGILRNNDAYKGMKRMPCA
ncbi:MAG: coenzyme F420-0:L-glutamate ligase [bacterium]